MFRMFSAIPAVFFEHEFFRRVYLVSLGDVVLVLAHRANHSQKQPLFFFRHSG